MQLQTYVRMKKLAAKEAGIVSFDATLPANVSQEEVCYYDWIIERAGKINQIQ